MINDYYFLLENLIVIGWQTYSIDKDILPDGQELIKVSTSTPDAYIGLTKSQMFDDPLPAPVPDESYKDELSYKRQELKDLYFEIKFTEGIGESIVDLQADFDAKLIEYNDSKP